MARETSPNPTVRILVIGAAGVGKNCLESRFATSQYPPPYDPSLTLCSRRFLTLAPKPSSDDELPFTVSTGLQALPDVHTSRPSLLSRTETAGPASPTSDPASPISFVSTITAPNNSTSSIPTFASLSTTLEPASPQPCAKCAHRANTYMVEVVNYPALQSAKMRQHIHNKGEYEAVLLVYDVSDRRSFERVRDFHAEIPVRENSRSKNHKKRNSHMPKGHPGPPKAALQRRGSMMSFLGAGVEVAAVDGEVEDGKAPEGVVVALVGNKADVGDEDVLQAGKAMEDEKLRKQDEEFVEDWESSSAVFGDALCRDPHVEIKPAAGPPLAGLARRQKPSHGEGPETVERWLQVVGKAAEEDQDGALDCLPAPGPTASRPRPGRAVPRAEGEDLARSLSLQVPFAETSAKTGMNVEEAFEAVVRSVLRQTGRGGMRPAADLAKRCRERHEAEQEKRAGADPGRHRGHGERGRLVLETKLDGRGRSAQPGRPAPVYRATGREPTTRRESFMGRMRRILTNKEP